MCQVLYVYFGCGHSTIKYNDCKPGYAGTTFLRIACPNYEPFRRHVPHLRCGKQVDYCSQGPNGPDLDDLVDRLQAQREALKQQTETLNQSVAALKQYRETARRRDADVQALSDDKTYVKLKDETRRQHQRQEELNIKCMDILHGMHILKVHQPGYQAPAQQPGPAGLYLQPVQPHTPVQQTVPAQAPDPAVNLRSVNLVQASAQDNPRSSARETIEDETPIPKRRKPNRRPDPLARASPIKETPEPGNLRRSTRARNRNVSYAASDVSSQASPEPSPAKSDAAWDSEAFESSASPVKVPRQVRGRNVATGQHARASRLSAQPRSSLGSIITDFQRRVEPSNNPSTMQAKDMFPKQQRRFPWGPSSAKSDIKPSLATPFGRPAAQGRASGYQSSESPGPARSATHHEAQIPRKRPRKPEFITPTQYAGVSARQSSVSRMPQPANTMAPMASMATTNRAQMQSGMDPLVPRLFYQNSAGEMVPLEMPLQQPSFPFTFPAPMQPQASMGFNTPFPPVPSQAPARRRSFHPAPAPAMFATQPVRRSSSFGDPMPDAALMQAARDRDTRRSTSRATMPPPPLPSNARMPVLTSAFVHPDAQSWSPDQSYRQSQRGSAFVAPQARTQSSGQSYGQSQRGSAFVKPRTQSQSSNPSYSQLQHGFDALIDLTPDSVFRQPQPPPDIEPVKRRRSVASPSMGRGQSKRPRLSWPGEDNAPVMPAKMPETQLPQETQVDEQTFDDGEKDMLLPSQGMYGIDPTALPELPSQQTGMSITGQNMPHQMQPAGQTQYVSPADVFTPTGNTRMPTLSEILHPAPQHDLRALIAGLEAASSDPPLPDMDEATNESAYALPSDPASEIDWTWDDPEDVGNRFDFDG